MKPPLVTVVTPGMGRVEALIRVAERINPTREAIVGGTGYIDDRCEPSASAMKGSDKWGRQFITLCVAARGKDDTRTYESHGVITIFQRHTDSDVVTQANNSRLAPSFIQSNATHQHMSDLDQLVALGSVYRTIHEVAGGTLYEHWTLVSPAEALGVEPVVQLAHETLRVAGAS